MPEVRLTRAPQTRVRHRLRSLDETARRAVCAICGPVSVVRKTGAWACEAKALRIWEKHLWERYRLTVHEYALLLNEQNGVCAICQESKALHVDHDHVTGAVRGLLCGVCNRAIGCLQDSPARLRAALAYLERHG